jgi:DNA polymerase-3 subunit delta'
MAVTREQEVINSLKRARSNDRLHHAYCFCGPVGVGKKETVEHFAGELFGNPERVHRGNHPDFVRVSPKEGSIKVDEIREVIRSISYAPLEAPLRVVLIENADYLNPQAANALLKTLEEPPAHTIFFLTAPDPALLLPTIRSRCQIVRFFPLSDKDLKTKLAEFPEDAIQNTLQFAEGSLERAKNLLSSPETLAVRREASEVLLDMWESCPRIPSQTLAFLDRLKEEEAIELTLATWLSLIRDFSFALSGAETFYNPEYQARLVGLAQKVKGWIEGEITVSELCAELAEKCSAIDRFRVQREFHLNLGLGLTALITDLQVFSVGKVRQKQTI